MRIGGGPPLHNGPGKRCVGWYGESLLRRTRESADSNGLEDAFALALKLPVLPVEVGGLGGRDRKLAVGGAMDPWTLYR